MLDVLMLDEFIYKLEGNLGIVEELDASMGRS